MLKQVSTTSKNYSEILDSVLQENKLVFNCTQTLLKSSSFVIEIEFDCSILSFRNHDYTWVDISSDRIANSFAPKIIQLQNGWFVQANSNQGIWEVNKKNPKKLLWKFNPTYSNSLTEYAGTNNIKKLVAANSPLLFSENPALLFSKKNGLELSRSKIPFSAIACFTDHCDYDTPANLKIQREFFKKIKLKVTKGFFLNHFSKREDNASFESNATEIEQWKTDGHELCYHSLSQSIKSDKDSFSDFETFQPPYENIPVWIDHGFQPYNFSLIKKNKISEEYYENQLIKKGISVLWNYIDCGTATTGIINQLNPQQFTLGKFLAGIQQFSFKTRLVMLFKNIIFHYDNDEKRIRNYIDAVANIRAIKNKKILQIFELILNVIPLLLVILKTLICWNSIKNKPYKVAKYSPLFFKHKINNKDFTIFQTVEMVDFKKSLQPQNIDLLIKESGLFVAHTYFSVDMKHYYGKLFKNETTLDNEVAANFNYLSEKILENKIWNPTLSQLLHFYKLYESAIFEVDENGSIVIKNNNEIPSRKVT